MALKPPSYILSASCPHSCFSLKEIGEVIVEGDIAVGSDEVDSNTGATVEASRLYLEPRDVEVWAHSLDYPA